MKSRWLILILVSLVSYGCFDIFREEEKSLVGDISLINPNNEEDKGYKMVLNEGDFNSNILEDYILDLFGNDTILIVKGLSKESCEVIFYKIKHNKGKKPISVVILDYKNYTVISNEVKNKYSFHSNIPECP